jgi:hypothetical protein
MARAQPSNRFAALTAPTSEGMIPCDLCASLDDIAAVIKVWAKQNPQFAEDFKRVKLMIQCQLCIDNWRAAKTKDANQSEG